MTHRRCSDERGSVALEFALVVPILLLIVMGIIDFGYMLNRDSVINNAARDGARVASLDGSYDQIRASVSSELDGAGIDTSDTSIVSITICSDGSDCGSSYAAQSGSTVSVTVTYTHHWITPAGSLCAMFGGDCTGSTKVLTRTAEMVAE